MAWRATDRANVCPVRTFSLEVWLPRLKATEIYRTAHALRRCSAVSTFTEPANELLER